MSHYPCSWEELFCLTISAAFSLLMSIPDFTTASNSASEIAKDRKPGCLEDSSWLDDDAGDFPRFKELSGDKLNGYGGGIRCKTLADADGFEDNPDGASCNSCWTG